MERDGPFAGRRILIVAAHPDDEVLGAGGQLARWSDRLWIVHATGGSPRNLSDAASAGFATRQEYARERRRELLSAVALAGIAESECHDLGLVDQEASFSLTDLARRIMRLILRFDPGVVLTHPYEGGHPDHDACAFASLAAVQTTRRLSSAIPAELWEFTSYHAGPNGIETGCFLPFAGTGECRRPLDFAERRLKRAMLDCFVTQQRVVAGFKLEEERFRRAPVYDFSQPPHPGQLFYENFAWGITGLRWRERAAVASGQLGVEQNAPHGS